MTLALPDGRRGQALAVALLLVALALAWSAIAAPLLGWYAGRADRLARERVLARHMEDLALTLPDLRRQAAAARASGPPPQAVIASGSDALAEAALQERLQTMATAAATTLTSAETLPAQPAESYRRVGVRIAFSTPYPALIGLLRAIDRASPRMLVDDLQLHSVPLALRGADLPLDVAFTVYAFRAATAAPPVTR